jgi:transcriptional regulator GlxA family with amidase domain
MAWATQYHLGPKTHWVANARWVESDGGKLWTASGVSAGTDACLAMIEHIYGKDAKGVSYADLISDGMEWNRVKDSSDDPFAVKNNVKDVLPQNA